MIRALISLLFAVTLLSCSPKGPAKSIHEIIPTLEEMSSVWSMTDTIAFMPSIRNWRAQALVNRDMTSISWFSSAPFSAGYHSGAMHIDGKVVKADQCRWNAFGAERKSVYEGLLIESSTRMVFEKNGILWKVKFTNQTDKDITINLSQDVIGFIGKYETQWEWWYPLPSLRGNQREIFEENFLLPFKENLFENEKIRDSIYVVNENNEWPTTNEILNSELYRTKITPTGEVIINDTNSPAKASFAFVQKPQELKPFKSGATATWSITIPAGKSKDLSYVMSWGDQEDQILTSIKEWTQNFDEIHKSVRPTWEDKWQQLFTPNNGFYSGNFPALETDDLRARRVYYNSPLTMLYLMQTNLPVMDRVVLTGGPIWGGTIMFFWDTTSWRTIGATTDPETMLENLKGWLTLDINKIYGRDYLSGNGIGYRYVANYWAIFQMLHEYLVVTGDYDFLSEKINGKTILNHMESMAYNWKNLSRHGEKGYESEVYQLADYGPDPNALLEAVKSYKHVVPSFNAGYVGMMKELSKMYEKLGNKEKAAQIKADAKEMANLVLQLYAGDGTWNNLYPNDELVETRHILDFHFLGRYMSEEMTTNMKLEMVKFLDDELLTDTWMRAQSADDPAAATSDRPDHGALGSYDGWPVNTMEALFHMGYEEKAIDFYRSVYPVTLEGTWSQARELWGEDKWTKNARVRIARRGLCVREAASGIAMANVMLREFFGFMPAFMDDSPLYKPNMPRSIHGKMHHINYQGQLYTITSDEKGLTMSQE